MNNATVTLVVTTTVEDDYGDTTSTTEERQLAWAVVAPRSSQEREDSSAPAVITAAMLYGPFEDAPAASATVIVSNHSALYDGEWQIEGNAGPWSSPFSSWKPGFEAALKRTGA